MLQTALLKRNVELDWYNSTSARTTGNELKSNHMEENENNPIIGYVINAIEPFSITAPHRLFLKSRHWYAITRLHRVIEENDAPVHNSSNTKVMCQIKSTKDDDNYKKSNIYVDEKTGHEYCYNKERWYIINSKNLTVGDLYSNNDLKLYLARVENDGGKILQATLKS